MEGASGEGKAVSQKVLLVDHDADSVEHTRSLLAAAGYEVLVANAAEQGLALFESNHPDLTVIEAGLPGKPGAELCREIKQSEAGAARPVVIVHDTENAEPDWIAALAQSGCDQLVERSVDDEDLLDLCRGLLSQASSAATVEEPVESQTEAASEADEDESDEAVVVTVDEPDDDAFLDQDEVGDAVGRLGTMMAEADDAPSDSEAVKSQGGDFSHILDEELNRDLPPMKQAEPHPEAPSTTETASVASSLATDDDPGEDISARLDDLFAGGSSAAPEPEAAPSVVAQAAPEPPASVSEPDPAPSSRPVEPPAAPAPSPAAGTPVPPVSPPKAVPIAGSTEAVTKVAKPIPSSALWKTTDLPKEEAVEKSRGRFWLVAACVGGLLLVAGLLILGRGRNTTPVPVEEAPAVVRTQPARPETTAATPPARTTEQTTDGPVVASVGPAARMSGSTDAPAGQVAEADAPVKVETPKPRPAPVKKPVPGPQVKTAPAPAAAPARAETPRPIPAPVKKPVQEPPVKTAPAQVAAPVKAETPTVRAAPAQVAPPVKAATPKPEREAAPARVVPPVKTETPKPEPEAAPAQAVPSVEAETSRTQVEPMPAEPLEPAEPVITQPELIERVEPTFPPKARKRGETGTVVLNVLVSETGRIIRVVVEEGVPGSEMESAAVSAVLRWRFRPATEDGKPVRAWSKARFVFE